MAACKIDMLNEDCKMNDENEIPITCNECNQPVKDQSEYCQYCGAHLPGQVVTINIFNNLSLRRVFLFYFVYLFISLLVKHTRWFAGYDQLFWVELVLGIITFWFAWLNRKEMLPVIRFTHLRWSIFLLIILFAALASGLVNYSMRQVNISFFNADINYFNAYRLYYFPTAIMIYSIAIVPAIFEEVAFRGVLYNYCANFLDDKLVVAVTAFLFAIMHLSLLSLIWLVPFGFLLGHLRRKYNTLWYGIAFHFVFNLIAVLLDLYRGEAL